MSQKKGTKKLKITTKKMAAQVPYLEDGKNALSLRRSHHVFKMEGKLETQSQYRICAGPSWAGPKTRFNKKSVSLA